jgi:membrane-associated HD superfamily phosphohydrolase
VDAVVGAMLHVAVTIVILLFWFCVVVDEGDEHTTEAKLKLLLLLLVTIGCCSCCCCNPALFPNAGKPMVIVVPLLFLLFFRFLFAPFISSPAFGLNAPSAPATEFDGGFQSKSFLTYP